MGDSVDDIERILLDDLDPEIIEFISTKIPWEYSQLYERLTENPLLSDGQRTELFSDGRGECVVRAMLLAAIKFGLPKEIQRLSCNGQNKLLIRVGRLIIIQEAISTRFDEPKAADYKTELANLNSTVRQLEFDFGDGKFRSPEWSGCILAVLQHAPIGPRFTRESKKLGALLLAVPDAGYTHWIRRFDLLELAMYGRAGETLPPNGRPPSDDQEDKVVVTAKRKNFRKARA